MSEAHSTVGAIGSLHRGRVAQRWSALRARVSVGRLDIELANGADPWSSTELMVRAARISSLAERRKLAAALAGLVEVALTNGPGFSPRVPVRHRLLLDHAEELVLLVERLRELEPMDVTTLAQLTLLVRDGRSPVYTGGRPPNELIRVLARALLAAGLR